LSRLSLIDRYLARSIAVPLFGTLILAAMLLVLDKMLRLFDFVVNTGGPVSVVWRMLANLLPEYFSLGIPIGLLLGILLAFRKLALSSELDALRGVGAGYGRLLRVPYLYATVLMLLNVVIVGYLQPYAHYKYEGLRFDLRSGALGASIKVGEFNHLGKRLTLRVDRSEDHGTRLQGIFVAADDPSGQSVAATAEGGRFLSTDDPRVILFRLHNGKLIQQSPKFRSPRTLTFNSYDLPITVPAVDPFRGRGLDYDELYFGELFRLGYRGEARTHEQMLGAQANFNFRAVEILIMAMIPMLAIALAVPPKRSTSALGIFVGIVILVAYHKVNQYGSYAGAQGRINPILAMWGPFAVLVALISWMYHVIAQRPGGQPIGALEWAAAKLVRKIRSLFRKVLPA
jgi:lipopolysaccharide export system permease protein